MKTIEDLETEVGKDLTSKIVDVLESEENAIRWFYDNELIALGGISPYEAYKKGMSEEIGEILGRIEYGIF